MANLRGGNSSNTFDSGPVRRASWWPYNAMEPRQRSIAWFYGHYRVRNVVLVLENTSDKSQYCWDKEDRFMRPFPLDWSPKGRKAAETLFSDFFIFFLFFYFFGCPTSCVRKLKDQMDLLCVNQTRLDLFNVSTWESQNWWRRWMSNGVKTLGLMTTLKDVWDQSGTT